MDERREMRRRKNVEAQAEETTGKERMQRTEIMEEKEWRKEILKEIRKTGQELKEEIRMEREEFRKGMREIRARLEKIERQQAQNEEAEEQEEQEERKEEEQSRRERETADAKEGSKKQRKKERVEEEKSESSEEGWSECKWGKDWWDEVANEEERGNRRGKKNDEMERGKKECDREENYETGKNKTRNAAEEREKEIRRRREGKEREKARKEERERREKADRKKRTLIWKRVTGEELKDRKELIESIMESVTGKMVPIRRMSEGTGADKRTIIFMELEDEEDKEEIIEKRQIIWRRWEIGVDEELTQEERAYRHKMVKKAKAERMNGRSVVLTNRRIWIDGREIEWDEEEERWRRV